MPHVALRRTVPGAPDQVAQLLLRTDDLRRRPSAKPLWQHDFVLHSGTLPGGFDSGLKAWLGLHSQRRVAIRELTSVLHAPFAYVDDRFLAYTRVVGGLMGDEAKGTAASAAQQQHDEWLGRVAEALVDEPDLRDAVLGKLSPSGPNARHQLDGLLLPSARSAPG